MSNFILLGICLLAGIVLRSLNRLPKETPAVLNSFLFHLSLPALILNQIHQIPLQIEALAVASVIWLLFGLSWLLFANLAPLLGWNRKTTGALILCAGLGNTSFVGFPMLEAFLGPGSLKTAIFADQMGSFLIVSSFGIGLASFFASREMSFSQISRRIFTFPPIGALILACLLKPIPFPALMTDVLTRLGSTLTPLALVSTGFQLKINWKVLKRQRVPLSLGLLFKLVLAPISLAILYLGVFQWKREAVRIALIESAMAPMITSAILSAEYELDTELANLMIGIGIPLSFLTAPIGFYLLFSN